MKFSINLTLIISFIFLSCNTKSNKSKIHFTAATQFYKKDNYKSALEEIDKAIGLDSTNLDFFILKAKVLTEINPQGESIEILKNLLVKNYKPDTLNYEIGQCYSSIGQFYTHQSEDKEKTQENYKIALKYYNNALKINNRYYYAYLNKQIILHNLFLYEEALITLNNAISLFPDSAQLICNRGIEKFELGDKVSALNDLNYALKSTRLDSLGRGIAYRFKGLIYQEKSKADSAINNFNKSINFNPKDIISFYVRAEYYRELGIKDKACEDYRKSADMGYVSLYKVIKEYCEEKTNIE